MPAQNGQSRAPLVLTGRVGVVECAGLGDRDGMTVGWWPNGWEENAFL